MGIGEANQKKHFPHPAATYCKKDKGPGIVGKAVVVAVLVLARLVVYLLKYKVLWTMYDLFIM